MADLGLNKAKFENLIKMGPFYKILIHRMPSCIYSLHYFLYCHIFITIFGQYFIVLLINICLVLPYFVLCLTYSGIVGYNAFL